MEDSKAGQKAGKLEGNVDGHKDLDHIDLSSCEGPKTVEQRYSTGGRSLSEWDAARIAEQGRTEIEEEIVQLEEELAHNPIAASWINPIFKFKDPHCFTWLLVIFASMGGFLSGLDQSLISGANLYMPESLHLDTSQVSLVSSGVPLGAIGGALLLGPVNEIVGRKMTIIISLILYTVGAGLEAGAVNYGTMIAGRVILGLGVGLESGTVPMYVAECVESKYRGNLVSLYQLNIALGEVFGFVVAAIFVNVKRGSWRYMLGSSLVFSTIMLVGMIFMPESPRFLMHKGRVLESFDVWRRIQGLELVGNRKEFILMKYSVQGESEQKHGPRRFVYWDFFTVPRARRSIVYAIIMVFLGQFTGINAIMYYMATLLKQVGFDKKTSVFTSLVGGGSLLLGTIPAIFYMEKFGRRFWACATLPGFFGGLLIIGLGYLAPMDNFSLAAGTYITGLIIYMAFFGSYACLTWVLPSEVFPTYLRSYGMETADVALFFGSWLVTYFFSDMQRAMTKPGLTLGFYGGIAVLGWFYQLLFMPETKNKTLEEIDILFSQPTAELVGENIKNVTQTTNDLLQLRWRRVFLAATESERAEKHADEDSEAVPEKGLGPKL